MRTMGLSAALIGLSCLFAAGAGFANERRTEAYVLKAGQELTFALVLADGKVDVASAKLSKLGTASPAPGEITVGLTPRDKDLYSQIVVSERTASPVDFVATGHIGEIVIDEREICGRLGAPFKQRIGGTSWTVVIRQFAPGKGDCEPPPLLRP